MNAEFADHRVVVMGLGRFGGGIGVARWLAQQGAQVLVTDRADESTLKEPIDRLAGLGVEFRCGRHDPADLDGADLLVVSPAVDKDKSDFVRLARRRGIPLTSEMNLFFERCRGRIVGVTGTTGKSTTCAMLHGILQAAEERGKSGPGTALLGGNIGRSLLGELNAIAPDDLIVLELSSFQLEDLAALRRSPPVAVITNISARHLERHGSFAEYLGCKLNVCRYQRPGDVVVVGSDDPLLLEAVSKITQAIGARLLSARDPALSTQHSALSTQHSAPGTGLVEDDDGLTLKVPGEHNRRNAVVAARVAVLLGIERETVVKALAGFGGLPHRLQFVRRVGGADYYNDSKATAPEAVAAALGSFDRAVILIAGGQEQPEPWDPVIAPWGHRIKHAICMGESGGELAGLLGGTTVGTLAEALAEVRRRAGEGDVVLFSPGCPSYDQFVNYEARGEALIRLVREM